MPADGGSNPPASTKPLSELFRKKHQPLDYTNFPSIIPSTLIRKKLPISVKFGGTFVGIGEVQKYDAPNGF